MKLQNTKKKLRKYPYVMDTFFSSQGGSNKTIKNQLVKWVKDGDLIRLRKGIYTLNNDERSVGLSNKLIANILYYPSYISLEYALSYYQMIPEAVFGVTSITSKKTQKLSNPFGEYIYKNIKKDAFFGYVVLKDEYGFNVLVASPEKALLDLFYLKTRGDVKIDHAYFEESLRLQNLEPLDAEKMLQMAKKFRSVKLEKIVKEFLRYRERL